MAGAIRVLYVDDESGLLEIGKLFLEESGELSVTTISSAPAALELLNNEKFDAIVSDYQMPGMDGIQFLVEVRARLGKIPFILFTGKGREEVVIQAINNGADFYLQKGGEPNPQFAELSHKIKQATSRKRGEEALRESEMRYKILSETTTDFIFSCIKPQGGTYSIDWIAGAVERIMGYTIDELIAMGCWRCLVHPDDTSVFDENITNLPLGKSGTCSLRIRTQSGMERWLAVNTTYLPAKDFSPFSHVFGGCRDITERKRTEDALKRKSETLSILNDIISTANKADDLPSLLSSILEESLRLLDFDAGGIYLVNRSTRMANVVHSKNLSPEFLAEIQTLPIDKKPYDTLFIENEPIFTENYAQISRDHSQNIGFQSMASIPLLSKGMAIGALNLASMRRYVISREEKETIISISRELGSTIERMASEEEVKKAATNLETLFNSIDEMVFVLDMQGQILAVNNTVLQRLSYSSEELIGTDVLMLHIPEQRDEALQNVQGMIAGTIDSCQVPIIAKDGRRIEVETKVTRGRWNNEDVLIGVSRDVTERKRMEEALIRSERLYQTLAESSPDMIFLVDNEGVIEYINPQAAKVFRFTPADLIGKRTDQAFPRDIASHFMEEINLVIATKKLHLKEVLYQFTDGARWTSTRLAPITGPEGEVVKILGIATDVTEYKQAEEALKKSELRVTTLLQHMPLGIIAADVKTTRFLFANDIFCRMLGYRSEDIPDLTLTAIHPAEDLSNIIVEFERMMRGESQYAPALRVKRRDGSVFFADIFSTNVELDGRECVLAVFNDITEREKAEKSIL